MTIMVIHIAHVGGELRKLHARNEAAVHAAIRRTVEVDAHRWIQWSIRGGGRGGIPQPRTSKPAKQPRSQKKAKQALLSKVLSKLKGALSLFKRSKGTPKRPAPDPCKPTPPPAYRVPIDRGDYANSWVGMKTPTGGVFYSAATPPIKAGVIEEGRRAAPIPTGPLAEWVRRKLGCNDPKKALGIAIAISKAAAKEPRPGLKVLARAHPKIAEALQRNLDKALAYANRPQPSKGRPKK